MSKRGNETPRKSKRLNDEARSEEFHAPSFNILSLTQTPKEIEKKRKGKEKQTVDESEKRARERGKKRKGKQIEYSSDSESDFVEELIKSK
ncbi:hypothetical protein EJD97_024889 [Solanum chilense]|uniref:Uncharacterized protein n=1 Tax=Solanum chilense TaxID=4083 RepID=A0A6N2C8I3_SOLCI|nr:hypothetical protein EJD97_024889 [Solanum chilense]